MTRRSSSSDAIKVDSEAVPAPPAERALRRRRRLQLLNACIAALYANGPSRTTIEKVVSIADMSPGIVNFYFESKDAMLVAVLQHVADEFDAQLLVPVRAMADRPAKALELLVERYLGPELATPPKVSVWYAFWSEANSRAEYHRICGEKDRSFAELVEHLIRRLIAETGSSKGLDAEAIALGLVGSLEMLWQGIALQTADEVDYPAARRRCMRYLASVFPDTFQRAARRRGSPAVKAAPAAPAIVRS